jgi:hypothetical protein
VLRFIDDVPLNDLLELLSSPGLGIYRIVQRQKANAIRELAANRALRPVIADIPDELLPCST